MIHVVPEVGSTNRALAVRVAEGELVPEGEWLVTDRQTEGRGRMGREWQDGAGNFMGSTLVHPSPGDPATPTLALVAGLAVHAVVAEMLADQIGSPRLKWPNDLLVGQAKLAGILLERERETVIVGIGVNLASAPRVAGRETIALSQIAKACDRDLFAEQLARQFDRDLRHWRDFGLAPIVRRWLAAAHPEGTALRVEGAEGTLDGSFAGLQDDGGLRVRLASGAVRIVYSGEVRLAAQVEV